MPAQHEIMRSMQGITETEEEQKAMDQDQLIERVHALEVAQATQAATQAGSTATLTASQAGAASTNAAAQAGTMTTNAAAQAGTVGTMVAGSVGFIVGIFLGLAISKSQRS